MKSAEDSILPVFSYPDTRGKLARMGRDVGNMVLARGENTVPARGYGYHVEDRDLIPQNKTMAFD